MRACFVFCFLFSITLPLQANVAGSYEDMNARLGQELAKLSQEPGKSLLALGALKQEPDFRQHPDLMVRLLEATCFSLMNLGRFAESAAAAEEGMQQQAIGTIGGSKARLLICKAAQLLDQGQLIEGYSIYTQALADAQGDHEKTAFVLQYRARFLLKYESYQDAVNDLQTAYELYNSQKGLEGQANGVLINLGMAYLKLRDYDSATSFYQKALSYFEQGNYPYIVARILHSLGETMLLQQDYVQAADYLLQSEQINLTTGNESAALDNYIALGKASIEQDKLEDATRYLTKGENIALALNRSSALIDIKILAAALAMKNGRLHELDNLSDLLSFKDIDQAQLVSVFELLVKRSLQLKDYAAASDYQQQLLELERRLYNSNVQQQVTQLKLSFDLKLAEKENLMLRISAENNEKLAQTNADKLALARLLVIISIVTLLVLAAMSFLLWLHNKKIKEITLTDELTGIPNRRAVMAQLDEQLKLVQRYDCGVMLGIVDIDHFKSFNDKYGHPFGDVVLKQVAASCAKLLRTTDIFGRLGGEEFLLLLPHTSVSDGMQTAERLRTTVAELNLHATDQQAKVTISIGITQILSSDSAADCYERADKALYEAKSSGRNKVLLDSAAKPAVQSQISELWSTD
jgi:diguanylate cyclase (GGDEF)-like protein